MKEKKAENQPFLLGEKFVLVDFTPAIFGDVARTFLPLVWNDHLGQFLLTFNSKGDRERREEEEEENNISESIYP